MKVLTQNKKGDWIEATPEPYYPSVWERIAHFLGFHQWTYTEPKKCVLCGIILTP